jgi:hypothetical protein
MDVTKWRLLPGHSLVEIEGQAASIGGIVIPERYRSKPTRVGRVVASNLTPFDRSRIGVDDILNRRVVVDGSLGRQIDGNHFLYQNVYTFKEQSGRKRYESPFLVLLDEETKFGLGDNSTNVKRCRFCGPAKLEGGESKANLMLVPGPRGVQYCPRCKCDEAGSVVNPDDLDEAIRAIG